MIRDREEGDGTNFNDELNPSQRTTYTKAVQQQELLLHHQQQKEVLEHSQQQRLQQQRCPPPHHYSMTMGSRRGGSRGADLSSSRSQHRNQQQQTQNAMRQTKTFSFEEEQKIDSSTNIPPLPLRCLGLVESFYFGNHVNSYETYHGHMAEKKVSTSFIPGFK